MVVTKDTRAPKMQVHQDLQRILGGLTGAYTGYTLGQVGGSRNRFLGIGNSASGQNFVPKFSKVYQE
jgi:hypothetical protein